MNRDQTIVMFMGESQYNVMRHFTAELAGAFHALGYDVVVIDMVESSWHDRLSAVIRDKNILFFCSMNGVGIELKVGQQSLYDRLGIPFFAFLVDHPMYHLARLTTGVNQLIVSCVDHSHVSFLQRYLKGEYTKVFIPHGAPVDGGNQSPLPVGDREVDVLFAGTCDDIERFRATWTAFGPYVANLYDDIMEAALFETETSLAETAGKVIAEKGIDPDYMHQLRFWRLLTHVDLYIRQYRRRKFVADLSRLPLKTEIYGNGWEKSGIEETRHLSFHPALDFTDIRKKMGQSKIVATVLPNFPEGGHERIFNAMQQGAVCLSDSNRYLDASFASGSDFLSYSWREDSLDHLEFILRDPDRLQEMADRGRSKVMQSHTWIQRASKILEAVHCHRFFVLGA